MVIYNHVRDHSVFMSRRGRPKVFELKGGGIPKLEGEGRGRACICTGLRGALKMFEGKLGGGGHAVFFRLLKNHWPYPNKQKQMTPSYGSSSYF